MKKKAAAASQVGLIVQVDQGGDLKKVMARPRRAGLHVERELPLAGVVGGHGKATLLDKMKVIPGVKFVRQEGGFQLAPLSESIPQ